MFRTHPVNLHLDGLRNGDSSTTGSAATALYCLLPGSIFSVSTLRRLLLAVFGPPVCGNASLKSIFFDLCSELLARLNGSVLDLNRSSSCSSEDQSSLRRQLRWACAALFCLEMPEVPSISAPPPPPLLVGGVVASPSQVRGLMRSLDAKLKEELLPCSAVVTSVSSGVLPTGSRLILSRSSKAIYGRVGPNNSVTKTIARSRC